MNFDEAFEHVTSGTATDEEKAYVEKEMANLRKIRAILDEPDAESVVADADKLTISRARKQFNRKTTIKIIVILFCSLLAIAVLVCGIIFIPSITSARRNQKIYEDEAITLAQDYLKEMGVDTSSLIIRDVDKELRIPSGLNHAIFVYEIEFRSPDTEYELEISTKSGFVIVTDIDYN